MAPWTAAFFLVLAGASAQTCSSSVQAFFPTPSVAPGYKTRLAVNNATLLHPRGITFDSAGHLLVADVGRGIVALTLDDQDGDCVALASHKTVIPNTATGIYQLDHGLVLSQDEKTLYASSSNFVWSWPYDAASASVTGANTTVVNNMATDDHTTRTLSFAPKSPGMLLVSRGSTSNIDPLAEMVSSGHSQIKAFNLTAWTDKSSPMDFDTAGDMLGWGLRNDVGMDVHPTTGGLWSVENSADQLTRDGTDFHENNPAEKLNYLGTMVGSEISALSKSTSERNYGYPNCFAAWQPSEVPGAASGLQTGMQFSNGTQNSMYNDTFCQTERTAPRLSFQAHMAPLDILFNNDGSQAWITFHGSWDRTDPAGYKVGIVEFANGEPVAASTSQTALADIVSNPDNSACPDACFRPVGLAWDSKGRMFFSSDSTAEIYVIAGQSMDSVQANTTQSGTMPSATPGTSGAGSIRAGVCLTAVAAFALASAILLG